MNVTQLGYLAFEVRDVAAWERFATEVLGLEVSARRPDGGFELRMDAHRRRFVVLPGPADDLAFAGWQVGSAEGLEALAARLRAAGAPVVAATEAEAAARGVARLVRFTDPAGVPSELYWGPALADAPFRSRVVRAGFVAGDLGLGHVVLGARSLADSQRFYCDVLGFRLSDHIRTSVYGHPVDMAFLHANARHHSLALGEGLKKRLHHFLVEVASMDEVGLAFDRALRGGVRIMQTLGRHPNDRMFSFYAKTPSGFQFEYGWGGREVDDATWEPTTYDRISEWGHHPPQLMAEGKIQ